MSRPDGSLASDDEEKAVLLNNFFSSVFTRENLSNIPTFPDRDFASTLTTINFDTAKILKVLQSLDQSKSPGPDGIHIKVLKELKDCVTPLLADLFNSSIKESTVPSKWKIANVVPLFKKGDRILPGNYRPVSLTSVVSKVMETIVRNEIVHHMDTNFLWTRHQHGFRKGRSCSSQLLEVIEDWSNSLDAGSNIDCIYLDYQKAYDSVPHERLLKKLAAYGIRGDLLDWTRAFF